MKFIVGFLTALAVIAAIVVISAYNGAYNIAATDPHVAPAEWLLSTTMYNSVRARAAGGPAPPEPLPAPSAGFSEYREMCVHCHGAPGVDSAEWAQVMQPAPPALSDIAAEWSARELHWIVTHGIKMSGMPAFGPTHGEQQLWEIVAFVNRLPELTPQDYQRLERQQGNQSNQGDQGNPGNVPQAP